MHPIMKKLNSLLIMNPLTKPTERTEFIVVHVEGGIISSLETFDSLALAKVKAKYLADRHHFDPESDDLRVFVTNAKKREFDEVWSYDPKGET